MATKYFILTKEDIVSNHKDQIMYPNRGLSFILPQTNIKYYTDHGLFESSLIDWCKTFAKPDGDFLDIGAHTGTYGICLSPHFRHVHCFEPQKMTYYSLCGSVALSNARNVTCHNFGLGSPDQVGTKTLKIVSNDGGGSSLHSSGNVLAEEEIEVKTLDSMNLSNVSFIKMDVEDNELYVLKGAEETLRRCEYPPMIFESNRTNTELFSYLSQVLGYTIHNINNYPNMFLASRY